MAARPIAARAFCSGALPPYQKAHLDIYGSREPTVAFLGTGPMALSFVAQMLAGAKANDAAAPMVVLFTEQANYYNALTTKGFSVVDERCGTEFVVGADQIHVVKNVAEYEAKFPGRSPQLVFGTMQMGQKAERWAVVTGNKDHKATVLSASNGLPYTTMLEQLRPLKGAINTGHATAYVKARAAVHDGGVKVTCTDAGMISLGAVGSEAWEANPWFASVCSLLDGPIYTTELSKNAKQEAMNKVIRNLTNPICLAATTGQYQLSKDSSEITGMRYGVHLENKAFANALNRATFQAGRALGFSSAEIAYHIGATQRAFKEPYASKSPRPRLATLPGVCIFRLLDGVAFFPRRSRCRPPARQWRTSST